MTDHLTEARAAYAAAVATGWPEDALTEVVAHILDHLKAEQAPQQLAASIRRGLADAAAGRTEYLGRFADDEPEPEPDYGPRPAGCCGACPPILGGGYDCTCVDNPRCDANKADRIDRDGDRWVWCDGCGGLRMDGHGMHKSGYGWTAAELDGGCGPLTFAPQPADTPQEAASADLPASQPEPDQHPDRPSKALPPEIDAALTRALADAWDQGYCARHADDVHATYTDNPYRQEQHRSVLSGHGITPREERQ